MSSRSRGLAFVLAVLCLTSVNLMPLFAQDEVITLSIGVDEWQSNYFAGDLLAAFEESHPNVRVSTVVLDNEQRYFADLSYTGNVAEFSEQIANFAGAADLLPITMTGTSSNYTRAGAFLDLPPLLNTDSQANLEDFYPSVLQSMQWDAGTWALPITANIMTLAYNKTAFDAAGLAYPDETWTLQDYFEAGRALTIYNDDGTVAIPGFMGFDPALLFAAEHGESLLDSSVFPAELLLDDPRLIPYLDALYNFSAETWPTSFDFDFSAIPLQSGGPSFLDPSFSMGDASAKWVLAWLPNARAGLSVQGYAISSGTENPQLAYELLQYLSQSLEFANFFGGDLTARQSVQGVNPYYDAAAQDYIETALSHAIPASEVQAFYSLDRALGLMRDEGLDASSALERVQTEELALTAELLADRDLDLTVIAPTPTPALAEGKVTLQFGFENYYVPPTSGNTYWQDAIAEFVEHDPEIGAVSINQSPMSLADHATSQDCFYLGGNVTQEADLSLIRQLDPYLAVDPNFDPDDMVNGTMAQVSRDGGIWALPMALTPVVMWYKAAAFENAGLPLPANDWTVSQWEDALRQLSAVSGSHEFGINFSRSLTLLAAAYGTSPIDYSQSPYAVNPSAEAVASVQHILDMVKEGLIEYDGLGNPFASGDTRDGAAMFASYLFPHGFEIQDREMGFGENASLRVTLFPRGTDAIPLSYQLSAAFISAESLVPDACYRWLRFIQGRPELVTGMPAQISSFAGALEFLQAGEDVVAVYEDFAAALTETNAVIIPTDLAAESDRIMGLNNFVIEIWVNKALDAYVFEDADLETGLEQAQQFAQDYANCTADIPRQSLVTLPEAEANAYYLEFLRCTVAVDPALDSIFHNALSQAGN